MKVLILGVNGFISIPSPPAILKDTDWRCSGWIFRSTRSGTSATIPRFGFLEGDITINREWVEYHIKKADVVVPLVAIANPAQYVTDPLRVFELDFEANLSIVRHCVKYGKRLLFPSTSEIYGMCPDATLTMSRPARWYTAPSTSSAGSTQRRSSCWTA